MIGYFIGLIGSGALLFSGAFIYILLNPEKVEKWSALLYKALSSLPIVLKGAHKQYVRHELQGRINEFTKELASDAPYLAETKVNVEWAGEGVTRKSFLQDGKVMLRLRRDDPEDLNFVHGSYLFVSASLLAKTKRYISPSQGQAMDLFVTTKLLEREKPGVRSIFLEDYLFAEIGEEGDNKVSQYYNCMAKLDDKGYFYPVLLQELEFLGDKVFGQRKNSQIISEVDALMNFLEPIALRTVGDEVDLNFEGDYCRFALVIVGKRATVAESGAAPYVTYIRARLVPRDFESIYLLGPVENKDIIEHICYNLQHDYDRVREKTATVRLRLKDGEVPYRQYLVVLRRPGVKLFQPAA